MVVIVDGNQVAELQVTGSGGGLRGNTLHSATITEEAVGVVVDQVEAGLVKGTSGLSLGHGKTNGVGETLAEGTGGDLNTGGVVGLGVTGGDAVNGLCSRQKKIRHSLGKAMKTHSESLQVVHAEGIAEQVEESILEHASVAVTVHEFESVLVNWKLVISSAFDVGKELPRHLPQKCGRLLSRQT